MFNPKIKIHPNSKQFMNTLAWNIAPNKAPMISIAEINVIESSERNIECFVLRLIPCNESIPR